MGLSHSDSPVRIAASDTPSPNTLRRGTIEPQRESEPDSGRLIGAHTKGPGSGRMSGRIEYPPEQARDSHRTPAEPCRADCLARDSWRADVGIGPYEKTDSGSVGADCISARAHRRVGYPIAEHTP